MRPRTYGNSAVGERGTARHYRAIGGVACSCICSESKQPRHVCLFNGRDWPKHPAHIAYTQWSFVAAELGTSMISRKSRDTSISRALISRDTPARAFCTPRKKPDCVTHVPGMKCHPCLKKGRAIARVCAFQLTPRSNAVVPLLLTYIFERAS